LPCWLQQSGIARYRRYWRWRCWQTSVIVIVIVTGIPYAFGNRQLAKLVSRHCITVAANIYNIIVGGCGIVAGIVYAVVVCLRNSVVITVYIAIIVLVTVIVTIAVAGIIGIGIIIAGSGIVIAIAAVSGLLGLAVYNHAAIGSLAVGTCDRNGMVDGRSGCVGVNRIKR